MIQIALIGLGLMGGSMGYALRGFRDCVRLGMDIDSRAGEDALRYGAVDRVCADMRTAVSEADLVLFCTFPHHIEESIPLLAGNFKPGAIVSELCGLKQRIVRLAEQHLPDSVDYVGIHPMAGREVGGFIHADPNLFVGTGFIITPCATTHPESVDLMQQLARHIGATRIAVAHAQAHDAVIAYSSDLMHIASTALCIDFHPQTTRAFTAGAFRDCTRIANIDPDLWTELLMKNAEHILPALDTYVDNLHRVRDALAQKDAVALHDFLEQARNTKKELDAR